MLKRCLSLILALLLLLSLSPLEILAAELAPDEKKSFVYVNPLYRDVLTQEDIIRHLASARTGKSPRTTWHESLDSAANEMRRQMTGRNTSFTLIVSGSAVGDIDPIDYLVEEAFRHTGVGNEGDYIRWHYGGFGCSYGFDGSSYEIGFEMVYYTTAEQEAQVDARLEEVYRQLDLGGTNSYEKVKAIYDYICANVTYDYENVNDDSYLLQYSAYAALMDGTAVCQGYAQLFYRMALDHGVDARFIGGYGGGGPHGWNIVKLGKWYYNLDSTWDAGYSSYDWFLLGEDNFYDHDRDPEYLTTDFLAAYPVDSDDFAYDGNNPDKPTFTDLQPGAFYSDAVSWAVDMKITSGTSANSFSPLNNCTRGEVVTFLWRALGCPTPVSSDSPFADAQPGQFYYDAVLWAVEEGITNGLGDGKFGTLDTVSRGQFVTFLWRALGEPAATSVNPFWDVSGNEFYATAVLWAVGEGITNGISETTFEPLSSCNRGQVVTFLYRALAGE